MFFPLLEGLCDPQCDITPLAVALYRRPAGALAPARMLVQDEVAFTANLQKLCTALYQDGAEDWRIPLSEEAGGLDDTEASHF